MALAHHLEEMAISETKFSFLVDKMKRLILSFLFVVSLICGLTEVANAVNTADADPKFIYGKDINQKIIDVLAEQGLAAQPSLRNGRRFRACNAALNITPLQGNFRTASVKCPDRDGWSIAVRTRIAKTLVNTYQAPTKVEAKKAPTKVEVKTMMVVTMSRSVKRGAVITADDVKLAPVSRKTSKHYFTRIQDVVARKATRNMAIDRIVEARQLELNWAIRTGEKVMIEHKIGPVQVLSEGVALSNAQLGGTARILNTKSKREVEGIVVSGKKIFIGANMSENLVVKDNRRR
jgi:flagella basal body P-ring formation protein FlgA